MKNNNIQVLRVICALVVFSGHALGMMKNPVFEGLCNGPFHLFFDGQSAVFVFFAISGFFYYKESYQEPFRWYYLSLLKRKIIKIAPPISY